MVKSSQATLQVPMFHYFDEVVMDNLITWRHQLRDEPGLKGTKLTFLPFVVKALSLALLEHPGLNCCLGPNGDELLQHHTHNIGVAMATSAGLVVPNVKQVTGVIGGYGWELVYMPS
jgi:2-oxoisovalerate dehydrogenase E2 component (dihydrolipoyl transacylase)